MSEPSVELAAWIRAQIDGWQDDGTLGNWPRRLFREQDALLIAGNQAYLWGLTPGGEVLCVDTDDFAQRVEPETDPRFVFVALASAAERFPVLYELLPAQPPVGVQRCLGCVGTNCSCGGLGWSV